MDKFDIIQGEIKKKYAEQDALDANYRKNRERIEWQLDELEDKIRNFRSLIEQKQDMVWAYSRSVDADLSDEINQFNIQLMTAIDASEYARRQEVYRIEEDCDKLEADYRKANYKIEEELELLYVKRRRAIDGEMK